MGFAPGFRVGRYEIVRKLGGGAFGVLYVARDHALERDIALKFLRAEHSARPGLVARFLREGRAAAKINHPGIVTVFECDQVAETGTDADGAVFIAMELLAGETLGARLAVDGALPAPLAIAIGRQVSAAVAAAHRAGIIHRDLKPDNLFLVPDPAVTCRVRVKVLDFGIAKLSDDQPVGEGLTLTSMVLGTPRYMSPEQCRSSGRIDHRSDIYAVGCILYRMLTGQPPYDGDAGELIAKHQLAPVPSPRALNPHISSRLDRLVVAMLAKQAADRPPSMEDVDDALAACEGDVPETAVYAVTPPPAPSKRWWVAGALGAIALGSVSAVLVTRPTEDPPRSVPEPAPAVARVVASVDAGVDAAIPSPVDAALDAAPDEVEIEAEPVEDEPPVERATPPPKRRVAKRAAVSCEALQQKGNEALSAGKPGDALIAFEASLACKPDLRVQRMAVIAACRARDLASARSLFSGIPAASASDLPSICSTYGVTLVEPIRCDADALRQQGQSHMKAKADAAALRAFDASLQCRPDRSVSRLAATAACRLKLAADAARHSRDLAQEERVAIADLCRAYGISLPR